MIAGCFGASTEAAIARLYRIGEAARAGAPETLDVPGGVLARWPGGVETQTEARMGAVWTGMLYHRSVAPESRSAWLDQARGPFSLIAAGANGILLHRGIFGGRPLFYAREGSGDVLVACSRFAPLAATYSGELRLNPDRLTASVAFAPAADLGATPLLGIRRLRSGETLEFGSPSAEPTAVRTWREPPETARISANDAAAELRAALVRAVQRAVGGASKVAIVVSGGLDSSAVLGALMHARKQGLSCDVEVFNISFEGTGDDRPYFEELARALDIRALQLRPDFGATNGVDAMIVDGYTHYGPTSGWDLAMSQLARQRGCTRLLSGSGGDDLFDGDDLVFDPWKRAMPVWNAALGAARLKGVHWTGSRGHQFQDLFLRPLIRGAVPERGRALIRRLRGGGDHVGSYDWARPPVLEARAAFRRAMDPGPRLRTSAQRIGSIAHAGYMAENRDIRAAVDAETGTHFIDPLLDDEVAHLAASFPPALFFAGGYVRGLLRLAMQGLVPERVRLRESKGRFEPAFTVHLRALLQSGALASLARMEGLGDLGIVDAHKYRSRFEAFARDSHEGGEWSELWPALAVEAYVQRFKAGTLFRRG